MPSETVICRIYGKPIAKERPRFVRATGAIYTPKKTLDYEKFIAKCWREQLGETKFDGAVRVTIWLFLSNMRQDVDNLAKSILDGLNGVAYEDDSQVQTLHVSKVEADEPMVVIVMRPEKIAVPGCFVP